MDQKLHGKSVILAIFWHFGPFWYPIGTPNPSKNRQNVKFQALRHVNLNSAPWKITELTYISNFRQVWKKEPPKRGVFTPKSPRGTRTRMFPASAILNYERWNTCLHILAKFQTNRMDGSKSIGQKVSFLPFWGIWHLLSPLLGTPNRGEIRQTVQFQALKHVNLSSAP